MSIIYTLEGEMITSNKLYEGQSFFRKMTTCSCEINICKILQKYNHKNIVKIYQIGENYIDMELLNIYLQNTLEIKNIMNCCKNDLQQLGIIYIDWKIDNIGLDINNNYKLFDFDGSGIIDILSKEWIQKPNSLFFSYRKAIENGQKNPIDIDNFSFNMNMYNNETKIF